MVKLKDLYREEGLVSLQDAATECQISVFNIYRWLREGKVEGVSKRNHKYVNLKSLKAYLGVKE